MEQFDFYNASISCKGNGRQCRLICVSTLFAQTCLFHNFFLVFLVREEMKVFQDGIVWKGTLAIDFLSFGFSCTIIEVSQTRRAYKR